MTNSYDNVTDEERQRVYEICKSQMGGVWADIEEKIIVIKRFTNGYINKVYYCEIPDVVEQFNPVVVKITCDSTEYDDWFSPLDSLINNLVLSEKNFSPKVYRIFSEGMISQFIKNRAFDHKDELNPKYASVLAKKLANFHSLKVPIPRAKPEAFLNKLFEKWFEQRLKQPISEGKVSKSVQESDILSKLDINEEVKWIKKMIISKNSPIVYTHSDFNRGNILVQENETDFDILFIDFDSSSYFFRGYDMGIFFSHWGFTGDIFDFKGFPSDEQMLIFIEPYIEECLKIYGNSYSENTFNSKEFIISESKLFCLLNYIVDILFCFDCICFAYDQKPDQYKEHLVKLETRTKAYNTMKKQFLLNNCL